MTYQSPQQTEPLQGSEEVRALVRLGRGRPGLRGIVMSVGNSKLVSGEAGRDFDLELEKRLLEIGFVEGAHVEILHEGFIGKDPIAVRVDNMSVALGRREADAVVLASENPNPRLLPDRSR